MTNIHIDRGRLARWAGLLLVATVLPLAGPAPSVQARAGCTTEEMPGPALPPSYGCDDTTDPDTRITAMTPAPNASGLTRTGTVTFAFREVVADGDDGPWSFRCRLQPAGEPAAAFESCTSPRTYGSTQQPLPDGTYTFEVYAVDAGDSGIAYEGNPLLDDDDEDPADPDEDPTPASRTWTQDTQVPGVSLLGGPYDREGTGWPIATSTTVSYLLGTDEDDVDFRCQLDGRDIPCSEGDLILHGLKGGHHSITAEATDAAGNTNTSLAVKNVTVPHNLTIGRNWRRVDAKGAFDGDLLKTRKAGATISYPARNVREVRLIAPGGGNLGKIRVRVADGIWHTIDLGRGTSTARRTYLVQDFGLRSGRIVIESLATKAHPVRVDALVFPHG